jgi:hypothetical protein
MLSKIERQKLNTDFYTALGLMMQGSYSELSKKTRWTNYRTNVKDIFVRLDADNKGASFCLDFQQKDAEVRALFWEQLGELKKLLQSELGNNSIWHESFYKEDGSQISRVELRFDKGSLYDKSTWPEMLEFLKESLLAFDRFWTNCFDIFKALED